MTPETILKTLNTIFIEVLDDEEIVVKADTTASDIEDWDSLTHIQLVSAIEKEYGLSFSLAELEDLGNVGDMVNLILSKRT